MSTVIIVLLAVLVLGLLGRAAVVLVRGVRNGWTDVTPSGDGGKAPGLRVGRYRISFLTLVVIGVLVGAWVNGMFDRALVNVGLNFRECATTFAGATFCGDDLDSYRRRVSPYLGEQPVERQTFEECRDEFVDLGETLADASSYCDDLR